MIAGINGKEELYVADITGNFFEYKATAIGENDEKIKEKLREEYNPEMTINESIKLGLKIFKDLKTDNFSIDNFDVAYIKKEDKKIIRLKGEELKKFD